MTKVAMAFPSLTGPTIDRDRRLADRSGGADELSGQFATGQWISIPLLGVVNAPARIDSSSPFPLMIAMQQP
jgi:hypothetical protein